MPFQSYNYFSDREFLEAEYIFAQKSANQIAREYGCSHSTILKYLGKFNIEIRPTCQKYPKGQIPYGVQLVNGQLCIYETEVAIIKKLEVLRGKGFSYHRIAYILTTLGIETKQKGSHWHATTVMKILRRRHKI